MPAGRCDRLDLGVGHDDLDLLAAARGRRAPRSSEMRSRCCASSNARASASARVVQNVRSTPAPEQRANLVLQRRPPGGVDRQVAGRRQLDDAAVDQHPPPGGPRTAPASAPHPLGAAGEHGVVGLDLAPGGRRRARRSPPRATRWRSAARIDAARRLGGCVASSTSVELALELQHLGEEHVPRAHRHAPRPVAPRRRLDAARAARSRGRGSACVPPARARRRRAAPRRRRHVGRRARAPESPCRAGRLNEARPAGSRRTGR